MTRGSFLYFCLVLNHVAASPCAESYEKIEKRGSNWTLVLALAAGIGVQGVLDSFSRSQAEDQGTDAVITELEDEYFRDAVETRTKVTQTGFEEHLGDVGPTRNRRLMIHHFTKDEKGGIHPHYGSIVDYEGFEWKPTGRSLPKGSQVGPNERAVPIHLYRVTVKYPVGFGYRTHTFNAKDKAEFESYQVGQKIKINLNKEKS